MSTVDFGHVVAFTGHRPDKLGGYQLHNPFRDRLLARLEQRLIALGTEHPDLVCISGMALGFDQWAAETCIRLAIPFDAAVPFEGQEVLWRPEVQEHYRQLLRRARAICVLCDRGYAPEKLRYRNEWMVDRCQHLVAAWNGSRSGRSGTASCVAYALRLKRSWENLLPLV